MSGEPIEATRRGIKALLADLRGDPLALESAYLSVITFSSSAHQVCPLTKLRSFQEPDLDASGSSSLGEALTLLEQCLDKEVRKATPTQEGDFRPLVYLMTNGQPTDNWQSAADRVKQKKICTIIACAAGPGADSSMLKRITESVVELSNLVSRPIKTTSQNVAQQTTDSPIDLPPPPPGIQLVP
jgi:uncharacterized protein YegL